MIIKATAWEGNNSFFFRINCVVHLKDKIVISTGEIQQVFQILIIGFASSIHLLIINLVPTSRNLMTRASNAYVVLQAELINTRIRLGMTVIDFNLKGLLISQF